MGDWFDSVAEVFHLPRPPRVSWDEAEARVAPLMLWPTLTALWLASSGAPSWIVVGIVTLGTLLMRSAGWALNDFADREFDPHVERTKIRPLAKREIAPWEALVVVAVLALCA